MKLKWMALLWYLSLWQMNAQKIYVVSVGIADYKEINDLRLTENDVRVFNDFMLAQGAEIATLLGQQATHAKTISALRTSFGKAQKEDTVIFFFSGHGYEGGFCCWDMSSESPSINGKGAAGNVQNRQVLSTANKYYGGLSYSEMQILFRNCRAGKKIVLADACFSGGLRKDNQLNLSVQSARNGDVVYFLSSRTDETSLEMAGGTNGLFTYYLAKGLYGESDVNRDKLITVKELFDYVYQSVVSYANKIPHSQHPVLWGRFDEAMPIISVNAK